jgi:hypothetical protein
MVPISLQVMVRLVGGVTGGWKRTGEIETITFDDAAFVDRIGTAPWQRSTSVTKFRHRYRPTWSMTLVHLALLYGKLCAME